MPTTNFTHDCHIVSATPDDNFGNTNPVNLQNVSGTSTTRIILNLNFGGAIPQVASATLRATGASAISSGTTAIVKLLVKTVEAINEDTVTWNNWNGVDAWPATMVSGDGGTAVDNGNTGVSGVTFSPPTSDGGTVDVDITTLMNRANTEGYENLPLIIRYTTEGSTKTSFMRAQESGTFFTLTYTEFFPSGSSNQMTGGLRKLAGSIS